MCPHAVICSLLRCGSRFLKRDEILPLSGKRMSDPWLFGRDRCGQRGTTAKLRRRYAPAVRMLLSYGGRMRCPPLPLFCSLLSSDALMSRSVTLRRLAVLREIADR